MCRCMKCLRSEDDVICRAEADGPTIELPYQGVVHALAKRPGIVNRVELLPLLPRGKPCPINAQHLQMVLGRVVEVVDAKTHVGQLHIPDRQALLWRHGAKHCHRRVSGTSRFADGLANAHHDAVRIHVHSGQRTTPLKDRPAGRDYAPAHGDGNMVAMTDHGPAVDGRHPADVVTAMVDHVLELAQTWPRWNGTPVEVPVDGEPARTYTPHKAVRRVADHLLDHLAELEARIAGRPTEPDAWRGSTITTPADLATFTEEDLDEARSRLRRLAQIWDVRLRALSSEQLDAAYGSAWSLRQVAFHVTESAFYADSIGALSA